MTNVTNNLTPEDKQRHNSLKDTVANMTPDQAAQFIETNVTDLESAKVVMKKMVRIIVSLAHLHIK